MPRLSNLLPNPSPMSSTSGKPLSPLKAIEFIRRVKPATVIYVTGAGGHLRDALRQLPTLYINCVDLQPIDVAGTLAGVPKTRNAGVILDGIPRAPEWREYHRDVVLAAKRLGVTIWAFANRRNPSSPWLQASARCYRVTASTPDGCHVTWLNAKGQDSSPEFWIVP